MYVKQIKCSKLSCKSLEYVRKELKVEPKQICNLQIKTNDVTSWFVETLNKLIYLEFRSILGWLACLFKALSI